MHFFWRDDHGATAIEYGMISALIVIAIIGGVQALGASVSSVLYSKLVSAFD
jgi:pilus assembly protein Flp/PilA